MKIEIWSDFVCPFCYIGKKRLEKALKEFSHNEEIEVEYKSYQLDPEAKYVPGKSHYETFAQLKGISMDQVMALHEQIKQQAADEGLIYNFDDMKYANTLDAHRVAKYAEEHGKGEEIAERLFYAHFTESKLLSDQETLIKIASEVDLDPEEVRKALKSNSYVYEVQADIREAMQLGVRGVPFFVFNDKYGVSGAQPVEVFTQVLEKVYAEGKK